MIRRLKNESLLLNQITYQIVVIYVLIYAK